MDATAASGMNRMYRHQRLIYDATRVYYLLGRDHMLRGLEAKSGDKVLEIGCGTARNLLQTADLYPGTQLFGVDISTEMLKTACASVAGRDLRHRIALGHGDATNFNTQMVFGFESADRIFISYALSMIPRWEETVEHALSKLSLGGSLHIVDFGRMDGMPALTRRALLTWLRRFDVEPRRSLEGVCHVLAARHGLISTCRHSPTGYWTHVVLQRA